MTAVLPRFVLAGVVLALAAAVVVTTGSGLLGGSLGSLFGYHARLEPPAEPVALASDVKPVVAASVVAGRKPTAQQRLRSPSSQGVSRRRPAPTPVHQSPPPSSPAPLPVPGPAPVVPAPSQGNVSHVEQVVRQVAAPVPAAQQPVDQAVQTVDKTCALIGGCP